MEAGFLDLSKENYISDKNPDNIAAIFYIHHEIYSEFLYFLSIFQIKYVLGDVHEIIT